AWRHPRADGRAGSRRLVRAARRRLQGSRAEGDPRAQPRRGEGTRGDGARMDPPARPEALQGAQGIPLHDQADPGRAGGRLRRNLVVAILGPAVALFALTMLSVLRLARMRFAAARAGAVDARFYKVFKGEGEPPELAAATPTGLHLHSKAN